MEKDMHARCTPQVAAKLIEITKGEGHRNVKDTLTHIVNVYESRGKYPIRVTIGSVEVWSTVL